MGKTPEEIVRATQVKGGGPLGRWPVSYDDLEAIATAAKREGAIEALEWIQHPIITKEMIQQRLRELREESR